MAVGWKGKQKAGKGEKLEGLSGKGKKKMVWEGKMRYPLQILAWLLLVVINGLKVCWSSVRHTVT